MSATRISAVALLAIEILLVVRNAGAQSYPNRPIRIVTTETGGGSDITARLIAPGLAANLGQQVIVDNRATGVIPGRIVSRAPPDGHTLLVYGTAFWVGSLLQDQTPYDVVRDFSPITVAASSPCVLVVHPSLAANSVKELIALAKAKAGTLDYATAGTGSSTHLAAELFKVMAGVDMVRISYRGTGLAINDVIGGQVQIMFATGASVAAQVKAGRLRALAVTSAQPSALFPALPTVAAAGLPGYESVAVFGAFAPAKTPATLINRLNQEIVRILNRPDVKEKFLAIGAEVIGNSPQAFAALVKSEIVKWGKVIKDAGIRAD